MVLQGRLPDYDGRRALIRNLRYEDYEARCSGRACVSYNGGRVLSDQDAFDISECPDFPKLDAAAPESAGRRTFMLALIGNLSFAWSNNESLFIYLIKVLMQTDEPSAVIVFVTLNTARSRVELVERLGRAKLRDENLRRELEGLILRFNKVTRIRNEFNHCMYGIDSNGVLTHTQSFRIRDVDGIQALERPKPLDDKRIAEMLSAADELKALNRALWTLLPKLETHLAADARAFSDHVAS